MIRKMLLTVAVAALVVPAVGAHAQTQSQVQATAIVSDYFAITGTGDLSFGTLARTQDAVISATNGHVTRDVAYNRNVRVTFQAPSALTGAAGSLPVTLYCASSTGGTWTGATSVCGSAVLDLNVGTSTTMTTLGFGGRIAQSDVEAALAGTYTGTIDITVVVR